MTHCVSDSCRNEIQPDWKFCPYCGTDNRPPEDRPKVRSCIHQFFDGQDFCIRCGGKRGDRYWEVPEGQRKAGVVIAILGGVLWLFDFIVGLVHMRGTGPLSGWVNSWYTATHMERSKYGQDYTVANGPMITSYIFLGGLAAIIGGFVLINRKQSKFYSDDNWQ